MSKTDLKSYLESNPRMIGVLFTIFLLLTQSGNAAAVLTTTNPGP